jgi:hypothetical protein
MFVKLQLHGLKPLALVGRGGLHAAKVEVGTISVGVGHRLPGALVEQYTYQRCVSS